MKKTTLLQRLNTGLMLLSIFLIICAALALWIEKEHSNMVSRSGELSESKARVDRDMTLLSEALRGALIDSPKEADKRPEQDAKNDLTDVKRDLSQNLDVIGRFMNPLERSSSVEPLRTLVSGRLSDFHRDVLTMARRDQAAAMTFYRTNHTAIDLQRDRLLKQLDGQISAIKNADLGREKSTRLAGSAAIVALLVASLFVGFKQSSAIAQPLNRLVASMERLRQGDFTQRLTVDRKDEFGVLGEGLNRLADDLSSLVGQVQRSGIQVNTTATEIAASAREQQSTAHQIAATTAQIGATSKEISATSKELVKTMNEVNQVAEETANLAGSGQTAIARMEATMRQITEASGAVTAKLAVLSEKTTNINSVVTTITKVADQTNLLSLNAAIEAEKAGEYGLGFAVVAMEIRRLADQTAVATYDIEKMVKEMQSAVAAGVMGMDKFSEEAKRGVEEIRQVSTHLAQIIHQVQTLTPRFQTVNEGMHAQATGAQQISEALTQLSEAAQQTAESLRQSNQAIEQLNGAARGLQTSVARFKLTT
jgi:methyl-accepting chemotaxis protein